MKINARRGKSFCHVDKMRHRGHDRPDITFGNQKCVGAAPNFVMKPRNNRVLGMMELRWGEVSQSAPRISEKAPKIWLRRYLVAASCSEAVLF